jgi:hypothetical protein
MMMFSSDADCVVFVGWQSGKPQKRPSVAEYYRYGPHCMAQETEQSDPAQTAG